MRPIQKSLALLLCQILQLRTHIDPPVVGFDMVDDESKPERRPAKHMKAPREWDLKHNPAYAYYAFYTYANLFTLNRLREARGLNTFALRPHAGALLAPACASAGCCAQPQAVSPGWRAHDACSCLPVSSV